MDDEQLARNRDAQADLYGEPLSTLFGRLIGVFGMTQAQLATALGVSAPMLSQLMGARRVKIGNPAALQRVHALAALADDVDAERVDADEMARRLDGVRSVSGVLTGSTHDSHSTESPAGPTGTGGTPTPDDIVAAVHGLLRAVASGQELHDVATAIAADHPALAELIRVYGVGHQDEALRHYARYRHLL